MKPQQATTTAASQQQSKSKNVDLKQKLSDAIKKQQKGKQSAAEQPQTTQKKQQQQQKQQQLAEEAVPAVAPVISDSSFDWDLFNGNAAPVPVPAAKKRLRQDESDSESSDDEEDEADSRVEQRSKKQRVASQQSGKSSSDDEDDEDEDIANVAEDSDADVEEQEQEAVAVREREQQLAKGMTAPQTDEDYERLIAANPANSFLWIQFMAHKLSVMDVEGARKIGQRALNGGGISAIHEQDVFNMYAALMNLEAKYGNELSQKRIFERARTYCEPKQVYLQQARVYEQNNDFAQAEQILQKAIKKFKTSRKVWESYILFELKRGKVKEANALLERSLVSLHERKHLKIISKCAVLHYKHRNLVHGNKLFEGIVSSYPHRTDMWSMFIDMELSAKRFEHVRQLFERVVHLKISTLKMKNFLQRYLRFEQEHGSEEGQEHVKQIAREFVSKLKNSS